MKRLASPQPSKKRSPGIAADLLSWYRRQRRDLPWRQTRDPYRIWVSEIMLQQTRVAAVIPYYERFLERFPTVEALAGADEQELLELWSGLGYYRRARQMQRAAREIVSEHGGKFPRAYEKLLALPGIGAYTAAAVASISFGRPVAVVDGNVIRALTRLLDEDGDVTRSGVRKRLQEQAQALLESAGPRRAGEFNQALMELGATLCTPRSPKCTVCPLAGRCRARKSGVQLERPVKRKKERAERLQMAVAVVSRGSSLLLRQRPQDSPLLPGFWELPQAEAATLGGDCFAAFGIRICERLAEFRHGITFRQYQVSVYRGALSGAARDGCRWIPVKKLGDLPLTTVTRKALAAA